LFSREQRKPNQRDVVWVPCAGGMDILHFPLRKYVPLKV